jgi:hypothetical protein
MHRVNVLGLGGGQGSVLQGCEQLVRKAESTVEGVQVPVPHVVAEQGLAHTGELPPHWPRQPAEGAGDASGAGLVHVAVRVPPPHDALQADQAEKPPAHTKQTSNQAVSNFDTEEDKYATKRNLPAQWQAIFVGSLSAWTVPIGQQYLLLPTVTEMSEPP